MANTHEDELVVQLEESLGLSSLEQGPKLVGAIRGVPLNFSSEDNIEKMGSKIDFCYRCGRIGHSINECRFEPSPQGVTRYGTWTRAKVIRETFEQPKRLALPLGEKRKLGAVRNQSVHHDGRHVPVTSGEGSGTDPVENDRVVDVQYTEGRSHCTRNIDINQGGQTRYRSNMTGSEGDRSMELIASQSMPPRCQNLQTAPMIESGLVEHNQLVGLLENQAHNDYFIHHAANLVSHLEWPVSCGGPSSSHGWLEKVQAQVQKGKASKNTWVCQGPVIVEASIDVGSFAQQL
ncbi:unnamed protein product [Prunus brigantina]